VVVVKFKALFNGFPKKILVFQLHKMSKNSAHMPVFSNWSTRGGIAQFVKPRMPAVSTNFLQKRWHASIGTQC
jgi:hypothetical protein